MLHIAAFAREQDLLHAVVAVRERNWPIVEAYTPYPVHGLDRALGWPRSHLPTACLFCGLLGVVLFLGFQFWTTAWDWPLNVGGQPWNSLPAFVPVTFEAMVLFAGLGLVLAWLVRCRLYPGKKPLSPLRGETNDHFVLVIAESNSAVDPAEVRRLLQDNGAVSVEQHEQ